MALAKDKRTHTETQGLSRRNILATAPFMGLAAAMTGATPVAAACAVAFQPDPFAVLVGDWFAARQAYEDAASLPGGGDFDTPECLHWYAERMRIKGLLQEMPITGPDGAAALAQMAWRESDADYMEQPVIDRWMLAKLRDWTEAQVMASA